MCARHDTIAVVDNGGQFTHLIATKIRNAINVKSIIVDPESDPGELEDVKGLILSGSPSSIYDDDRPGFNRALFEIDVPVLGLCYGLHLIARHYGGQVEGATVREYGHAMMDITTAGERGGGGLLSGLSSPEQVWMSHGDSVSSLPDGFVTIGSTPDCPFTAIRNEQGTRFGLQFHPEVEYTPHGTDILRNFVVDICGCETDWTVGSYLEEKVAQLREVAGDRSVFLLASGGVDSTVCAALLARAISPERLRVVHIDNGLMRKDESAAVLDDMRGIGVDLKVIDASDDFVGALAGEAEPERKRNIIGQMFIDVADRAATEMGLEDWLLAQGTIYPDTIESGSTKHADVIKTHHNRVPIIEEMIHRGKIVEPISELYKVEVRELGRLLGLPEERIMRHPFPGPGLGIRLLCSPVGEGSPGAEKAWEVADGLLPACREGLERSGLEGAVLPIKSVGVMGDARSYEHPLLTWWKEPRGDPMDDALWERLWEDATRITNHVRGVNRVIMLLRLPPSHSGPMEGHPSWLAVREAYVDKGRLDVLREADALVMSLLEEFGIMGDIWQCPTVLLPVEVEGGPLAVVRPIYSARAMTARAAPLPPGMMDRLEREREPLGLGGWSVDLTHKPPGTIEWE
jgi:GMP synthase (glutamine-hydrolysing)